MGSCKQRTWAAYPTVVEKQFCCLLDRQKQFHDVLAATYTTCRHRLTRGHIVGHLSWAIWKWPENSVMRRWASADMPQFTGLVEYLPIQLNTSRRLAPQKLHRLDRGSLFCARSHQPLRVHCNHMKRVHPARWTAEVLSGLKHAYSVHTPLHVPGCPHITGVYTASTIPVTGSRAVPAPPSPV